jgi:hypothetical protein
VDDRTAERRAEEVDDQLTIFPEAVLALPLPVDGERRIAEQSRPQVVDDRRRRTRRDVRRARGLGRASALLEVAADY